jgi:hypothetical protein
MDPAGKDAKQSFREIFKKLKSDFKGWRTAIAVPQKNLPESLPFYMKRIRLFHGGVQLCILYGNIPG